jgi:hypothetical protein
LSVRQICVGREKHFKPNFLGGHSASHVAQRVPP